MLARSAAVPKGAGSFAVAPVRAIQLGTSMPPQAVFGQLDATEESRRHAQIKYFNRLHFPEFTGKGTTIEVEDSLKLPSPFEGRRCDNATVCSIFLAWRHRAL